MAFRILFIKGVIASHLNATFRSSHSGAESSPGGFVPSDVAQAAVAAPVHRRAGGAQDRQELRALQRPQPGPLQPLHRLNC